MANLVKRRMGLFAEDSSNTNTKATWWIPSRGIRLSVDLANLRRREERRRRTENMEEAWRRVQCTVKHGDTTVSTHTRFNVPELVIGVSHLVRS